MVAVDAEKTHVALLAGPGLGHVTPLLELAKHLVINHGFHVSFLVFSTIVSEAQNQLLHSPTLPSHLRVVYIPSVDHQSSSIIIKKEQVLTGICTIVHESLVSHLRSILLEINRPKALIVDMFGTEALDICKELSISAYVFFTSSAKLLAFSLYLPKLDQEVECEFVDLPEPVQIPGCKAIKTEDLLDQVCDRKIDEYKWYLYHSCRFHEAAGILTNTWDGLETTTLEAFRENTYYKDVATPPIHFIGPLIKEIESETETEGAKSILSWLENQPNDSVIFVALGSAGTLSTEQLAELTLGLEMSGQRFILVTRKPSNTSAATFFNVGSDENDPETYLPEGFLNRTEGAGVGLVVPSWAPQAAILHHPATGAFLSHCGWNSSLESLVNGVPMIAWPLFAEQRMNATFLTEEIGVALKLTTRAGETVIRREEINRVVRLALEGKEGKAMRRRAKELQDSAKKATETVSGSSSQSIRRLAELWRSGN